MTKNYFETTFKNEDINRLVDYLEYEGFDKNEKEPVFVLTDRDFEPEGAQDYILFPGDITVQILNKTISIDYEAEYHNYITNKNNKFREKYTYDNVDEVIANVHWYLNNNPINDYMANTILFENGKRIGTSKLEQLRNEYYLRTKNPNETEFLFDCGFETLAEYNFYILDLEAENNI